MSLLPPGLRAFLAVARRGTVHGAADELGLTQTGVTQRIRSLERELRTTLFLRSRRGMALTQEGEALLRYCRGAIELEGEALGHLRGAGTERPVSLRVAGPTSVMTARVAPQCLPVHARWPRLSLHFHVTDAADRVPLLRTGEADLAIVAPDQVPAEMEGKMLKPERYVLVATPAWKGRRLVDLLEKERAVDFDQGDPTTLAYLEAFGLQARLERPRLYANNNEILLLALREGVGFGTLTQAVAKPHLEAGTLIALNNGATMEERLALAWYPRPEMPPYFRDVVRQIK